MKITFIVKSADYITGGNRVISIYADRLQRKGHQVSIVSTPTPKPSLRDRLRSLLKGQGWISTGKKSPSYFDKINVPHQVIQTLRPIADADVPDADVVIATWWETAEWVANLSHQKGAKVYFIQHHEVHDYFTPEQKERAKATYLLPMHKITISQWLIDVMQNYYGDTNVSLVPNSVDLEKFYSPPRGKQPSPTVGMMYSRITWKGCDISLKAVAQATQTIPNLKLIAFGSVKPAPELPLPDAAEYYYQPSDQMIKDIYAQCDAWLFGSRVEGFGLPILEAMACRTPVIGTPAGAAPELLSDGAGILVQPENPEDMAQAIAKICTMSETEWRAMSDQAFAKATSYTWDDATELFEQALYTAIERSKKGDFSVVNPPISSS